MTTSRHGIPLVDRPEGQEGRSIVLDRAARRSKPRRETRDREILEGGFKRQGPRPILVRACRNCARQTPAPAGPGRTPVFCGDPCRRAWWAAHPEASRRRRYERRCPRCGRAFTTTTRTQRWCSMSCGSHGDARLAPQTCVTCGGRFQPGGRAQRNCGSACAVIASATANQRRPRRGVIALAQICAGCGTAFHRIRIGTYCSPTCARRKYRRRDVA